MMSCDAAHTLGRWSMGGLRGITRVGRNHFAGLRATDCLAADECAFVS